MSTLAEVQAAIAAYQQSEADLQAQVPALQAAQIVVGEVTAAHLVAVDAAAVAIATAQADFDTVQAVINGLVNDQSNSFQGLLSTLISYVPE